MLKTTWNYASEFETKKSHLNAELHMEFINKLVQLWESGLESVYKINIYNKILRKKDLLFIWKH